MKKHGKSEIIMDLTSLLDVVFIMLIILLSMSTIDSLKLAENNRDADARIEQAETAQAAAEAARNNYISQMETLQQGCDVLSLTESYDPARIIERTVHIVDINGGANEYTLRGANTKADLEQIRTFINEQIEASAQKGEDRPIILALNDNDGRILYRDEQAFISMFTAIREDHANVHLRLPADIE